MCYSTNPLTENKQISDEVDSYDLETVTSNDEKRKTLAFLSTIKYNKMSKESYMPVTLI